MKIEDKIDEYLSTRRSTLWGRHFDLSQWQDVEKARTFLLDLFIDFGFTNENVDVVDATKRTEIELLELRDRIQQVRACLNELEHLTREAK